MLFGLAEIKMNKFHIEKLTDCQKERKEIWKKVNEIFFLNAVKKFNNDEERLKFSNQWLLPYWESAPDYFYLLLCDDVIAGYLSAHPDTTLYMRNNQNSNHVSYSIFETLHKQFPAHLHINLHPEYTGHGGGELLMKALIQRLRAEACPGLHIVTSANARNKTFYRKLGLLFEKTERIASVDYLFMGINLSANVVP
jgi:GNAT superfamily N-acetyltransferase